MPKTRLCNISRLPLEIWRYISLFIALALFLLLPGVALAQTPPDYSIIETHGFQCLGDAVEVGDSVSSCDMLILVRYEMDKSEWRNADYMETITCVNNDELYLPDPCNTSLFSGIITHTAYNGVRGSATLIGTRTPPRVGHGISAHYFPAGHGLTFGDATYETCLEPSSTVFDSPSPTCENIQSWHDLDTDDDGLADLDSLDTNATALQSVAVNLESALPGRKGMITTNSLITPYGSVYMIEAYTNINKFLPDAFTIQGNTTEDISANDSESEAEQAITTDAQNSDLYTFVDVSIRQRHLNSMDFSVVAAGLVLIVCAAVFYFVARMFPGDVTPPLIVAALTAFGGVLQDFVDMKVYYTMMAAIFTCVIFPVLGRILNR